MDKIFMDCKRATAIVEKRRDGKLTRSERLGLFIHLLYCSICKLFFKQSDIIDKSYHYYAEHIDQGGKIYSLSPIRKEAIDTAFKEELRK